MSVALGARAGTVESFDDPRGIGVVCTDEGQCYPFHCTAVTDGTRTIAPGTTVTFRVAPGRRGCWEAADVTPVTPG